MAEATHLDRARLALDNVGALGEVADDPAWRLQAAASGVKIGELQRSYALIGVAHSLTAIAETLERIAAVVAPQPEEFPHG